MYQLKTSVSPVENSVHYIKELKEPVVLHIGSQTLIEEESFPETGQYKTVFKSKHRIAFEFFDPKTMKKIENKQKVFDVNKAKAGAKNDLIEQHQPILIDPEGLDCGYVAHNYDALSADKKDSFVVVLYHTGAKANCKFVKFQRTKDYWETFEYKYSDLTTILGHPWDFVRENAMLDHKNAKEEDYMKKYWKAFTEKLAIEEYKKEDELLE